MIRFGIGHVVPPNLDKYLNLIQILFLLFLSSFISFSK